MIEKRVLRIALLIGKIYLLVFLMSVWLPSTLWPFYRVREPARVELFMGKPPKILHMQHLDDSVL